MQSNSDLIETAQLALLMEKQSASLRLIDMASGPSGVPQPGLAEYREEHIPGAIYFNFHDTADKECPGKVCDEKTFVEYAKQRHIRKTDLIVCYDHKGVILSPRPWFVFRLFGAQNVKVLNGGLPKWKAEGRPIEKGEPPAIGGSGADKEGDYDYKQNKEMLVDIGYVNSIIPELLSGKKEVFLVDARWPEAFGGTKPESIPGMRAGHVKGAVNIPAGMFIAKDGISFKSIEEVKEIFESKGVRLDKKVISMCMMGVLASSVLFNLWRLGKKDLVMYNGNWREYGLKPEPNL